MSLRAIEPKDALALMEQNEALQIVDIRGADWFAQAHITQAIMLDSRTLEDFLHDADLDAPVLVYCHHGISSIPAGEVLAERGFSEVLSLNGGFEQWRQQYPRQCTMSQ
ncbi:MAG: thiosulfate sulfurtransferase GlpE [Gammaproteobacteria bacterium]|nr:MAG: thiosulfate sulfurtransferase GlpE [Gammaproteobacteria bacterium]